MKSELKTIILNDLCEQIIDSEHKTAPTQLTGIPYVRTPNVKNTRLILNDALRVSEDTYQEWTKRLEPKPHDIILCREAPVGDSGMILPKQKVCLGQRTVLIRPNKEKIYPKYLLFLLNSPNVKHELLSNSGGTHVDHLNMKDIRNLNVKINHSKKEQKIIGDLLFNLNLQINSKEKQNKILQQIVQTIFKSWFIDFDSVNEFEGSELGKIPKGWKIESLENISKLTMGISPPGSSYNIENEGVPLLNGPADFDEDLLHPKKFTTNPIKICEKHDILLCIRATIGNVTFSDGRYCLGRGVASLTPIPLHGEFLYKILEHYSTKLTQESGGSVIIGLTKSDLEKLSFPYSEKRVDEFYKIVNQIFKKLKSNTLEIKNIIKARDSLLPKLLSGEIRI